MRKQSDHNTGERPAETALAFHADGVLNRNARVETPESGGEPESRTSHIVIVLKRLFLFMPGAIALFYMSLAVGMIFAELAVFRRPLNELPDDYPHQFAIIGSLALLGGFMSWCGLGDLRNRRHFSIPASIAATGAAAGILIKSAAKISDLADRMIDDFGLLIYLLPLALAAPVLAKAIADRPAGWAAGDGSH